MALQHAQQVVPGVYRISLGIVNAFLLDSMDSLTLIDTGIPGSADKILAAVRELGKQPDAIRHLLVTHLHADHTGSLAVLKAATGAPAYMHPADAALVREGQASRPMRPAPGLMPRVMFTMMRLRGAPVATEAAAIEHEINDGQTLPIAGGLQVIHAPGHSAGQVVFLWPQQGGVLFVADAAGNIGNRLGPSIVYEDLALGMETLTRLAHLSFEVACFGHGAPIKTGADHLFRQKWGHSDAQR